MKGKAQIKTSQYHNIQSNAIYIVCVLVSCYLCFCPAEKHVFYWRCHLQCGLLSILVLVLEAEVLPAVALGLHRGSAFLGWVDVAPVGLAMPSAQLLNGCL